MQFAAIASLIAMASAQTPLFSCNLGKDQVAVSEELGALVYRFGTRRRAELTLRAKPTSGTVFYHRTLYSRGEEQALRFTNAGFSYVVFSHWQAPSGGEPETVSGGLAIWKGGKLLSRRRCITDGDMREYPIFKRLPSDTHNWASPPK